MQILGKQVVNCALEVECDELQLVDREETTFALPAAVYFLPVVVGDLQEGAEIVDDLAPWAVL